MLGCSGSNTILELQKLENRAARILTNSTFDAPSSPIIKKLGWVRIADLISFESNQLVFKSLNNQAPQYICNPFQRNSDCSSRELRNIESLNVYFFEWKKNFSYRGATLWKNLAIGVKQAPSLSVFKKRLLLDN